MCDGEPATGCDIINLAEYDSMLKKQLTKLDDQFLTITQKMEEVLKHKKEEFIKMYRKDPRILCDDDILRFQKLVEDFALGPQPPAINPRQIVSCHGFSDRNKMVTVSKDKQSIEFLGGGYGYCFIKYPKPEYLRKIIWSLRLPKCHHFIGKAIAFDTGLEHWKIY